jgi:hypothetical protein
LSSNANGRRAGGPARDSPQPCATNAPSLPRRCLAWCRLPDEEELKVVAGHWVEVFLAKETLLHEHID